MRYAWCDKLYISDNLPKDARWLRFAIEHRISIKTIYLINLSDFPDGQLEIVAASEYRHRIFRNNPPQVVGIAKGYYHARTLVERIVSDVYEKTGGCDCKSYFREYF